MLLVFRLTDSFSRTNSIGLIWPPEPLLRECKHCQNRSWKLAKSGFAAVIECMPMKPDGCNGVMIQRTARKIGSDSCIHSVLRWQPGDLETSFCLANSPVIHLLNQNFLLSIFCHPRYGVAQTHYSRTASRSNAGAVTGTDCPFSRKTGFHLANYLSLKHNTSQTENHKRNPHRINRCFRNAN